MDILTQFTRSTMEMVATTFLVGASLFEDLDDASMLEQLFCFLVRDVVLDELEGIKRTPRQQLDGMLGRIDPTTPAFVMQRFRTLDADTFGRWYQMIREKVDERSVDLNEFANALRVAKQIMSAAVRARK